MDKKVVNLSRLLSIRPGGTIVWTNGCFDLLHVGHVRNLQAAAQLGDTLVVGVNSDKSARQLKGEGRPIITQDHRAEMVAALECVDYVLIFDELTPEHVLHALRPDVHCKGGDYAGKFIPEQATVEAYGGRVEVLPLVSDTSTTGIICRIQDQLT